jgi:hypothetical protein
MFSFVQVQGQFHITVELDSRQAARKGDPAGLRESQREDFNQRNTCSISRIVLTLHFVRNLSLTQELGKRGRFSTVSQAQSEPTKPALDRPVYQFVVV